MDRTIKFAVACMSALACAGEEPNGPEFAGAVTRVVDGDSLYENSIEPQIRLFGVDAPQRDEAGFAASNRYLTDLAFEEVVRRRQVDIDRYSRIVARCVLRDGREINRLMFDEPHTFEYCQYLKGFYGTC